jgi:hypothetical protein
MFAVGCGGDDSSSHAADAGGMCTAALPLDCQPAFPPTYDMIYGQLLSKTCGNPGTGGSCHSAVGKQGGLVLADIDGAYTALVTDKNKDGLTRVLPNDPACSILEERLESSDPAIRMPLGNAALSEPLRCAVRQWIAMGAPR